MPGVLYSLINLGQFINASKNSQHLVGIKLGTPSMKGLAIFVIFTNVNILVIFSNLVTRYLFSLVFSPNFLKKQILLRGICKGRLLSTS